MPDAIGGDTRPAARRPAPSGGRAAVALALTVLLVAGVVVVGYLAYRQANPTADPLRPASGPVLPSDRDRAEAVATAEQFTLRMDNVDGTKFDEYVKGVDEMLTTKAKSENTESLQALEQAYKSAKVKGKGKVLVTGVSGLTDDDATVLVAHDAQVSTAQGDIEHHYRWTIALKRVDGAWLVDSFQPVT